MPCKGRFFILEKEQRMDFKQTVKNIPPMRWVTYAVCTIMVFVMIGITVYRSVTDTLTENMAIMLGNIAIWLVPFVARPIFKDHVGDGVYLFFVIYVFFASFLGTIMTFYEDIWWYDLLIHTLFGYVGCIIGLFAACKLCDIQKISPAFAVVFCVAFSMMLAALWEIMEYLGDQWMGNNAQGKSVNIQELADSVGVSRPAIRKYLKPKGGAPTTPSASTVCEIARYFGTTPDFLLGFDEPDTDAARMALESDYYNALGLNQRTIDALRALRERQGDERVSDGAAALLSMLDRIICDFAEDAIHLLEEK